ncbi:MAG TPA: DinB family protein [Flavisolibacter sp.]|jgi:uncharacterized damage-inducible protein DinB|nr:DinB family protein [Flavisolibacter sp.]
MMTRLIYKAPKWSYPAYAEMYMKLLPDDGLVLQHLRTNCEQAKAFVESLPEDRLLHRYSPGKWTIKEILVHIIDDERIFAYRALRFARGEQANLIGFDQDAYALQSEANTRSLASIFDEYDAVRRATLTLFQYLPEAGLDRLGHGTGSFNDATPRALVYHIAGHELHHMNFIREHYLTD